MEQSDQVIKMPISSTICNTLPQSFNICTQGLDVARCYLKSNIKYQAYYRFSVCKDKGQFSVPSMM